MCVYNLSWPYLAFGLELLGQIVNPLLQGRTRLPQAQVQGFQLLNNYALLLDDLLLALVRGTLSREHFYSD
jgi:hypothetical protein